MTEVGDLEGVSGQPTVLERPRPFDGTLRWWTLPPLGAPIADLAFAEAAQEWFALSARGEIFSCGFGRPAELAAAVTLIAEEGHKAWNGHHLRHRLHVSPNARYAAVVNDFGRFGTVIDLATGDTTMDLDGGGYHPETVPFSVLFGVHDGDEVLVHRTDWNRLDVSDPASGRLLTDRGPTSYQTGEDPPEHYLDYFHGELRLSPDGNQILDDGWVWHPMGVPLAWSLQRWLAEDLWESENAIWNERFDQRDDWNHGMCWIDARRVAIQGLGTEDLDQPAGVRLFDTSQRRSEGRFAWAHELLPIAGPTGHLFSNGSHLFSAATDGLSIWEIETGARVGMIEGFVPAHHARSVGELVALRGGEVVSWRYGELGDFRVQGRSGPNHAPLG